MRRPGSLSARTPWRPYELTRRLRYALARIRDVPSDLGETYESVYNLIRRGGPHAARGAVDHQAGSGNSMSGGNLPLRAAVA